MLRGLSLGTLNVTIDRLHVTIKATRRNYKQ